VTPSKGWIIVIRGGSESIKNVVGDVVSCSAAWTGIARMTAKTSIADKTSATRDILVQEYLCLKLHLALHKVKAFSC
jgi:hypothetical protein